jgi:hypothetical protein
MQAYGQCLVKKEIELKTNLKSMHEKRDNNFKFRKSEQDSRTHCFK